MKKETKLIVLFGPNNCGKTATLTLCCDTLISTHGATINTKKKYINQKDFEVILDYKGKTVAIYTMGDRTNELIAAIKKYASIPVDVLIIALNVERKRPWAVIKNYSHSIIEKVKNAYDDPKKTNEIIKELDRLLPVISP
jgi:ABC-type cobalamin/Fe3+-siderophores transport system ATPase subunit